MNSRRTFLSGTIAATLVAIPAKARTGEDSAILAACRRAQEANREYDAVCRIDDGEDERLTGIFDRETAALYEVINSDAASNEGLQAKARLLLSRFPLNTKGRHQNMVSPEEELALSIARDLLRPGLI